MHTIVNHNITFFIWNILLHIFNSFSYVSILYFNISFYAFNLIFCSVCSLVMLYNIVYELCSFSFSVSNLCTLIFSPSIFIRNFFVNSLPLLHTFGSTPLKIYMLFHFTCTRFLSLKRSLKISLSKLLLAL